jgi:hypothetical protein
LPAFINSTDIVGILWAKYIITKALNKISELLPSLLSDKSFETVLIGVMVYK